MASWNCDEQAESSMANTKIMGLFFLWRNFMLHFMHLEDKYYALLAQFSNPICDLSLVGRLLVKKGRYMILKSRRGRSLCFLNRIREQYLSLPQGIIILRFSLQILGSETTIKTSWKSKVLWVLWSAQLIASKIIAILYSLSYLLFIVTRDWYPQAMLSINLTSLRQFHNF